VVNSHWHGDHVRGNQAFPGVEIVSTGRTKELVETVAREQLAQHKALDVETVLASLAEDAQGTFDKSYAARVQSVREMASTIAEVELRPPTRTFEGRLELAPGCELVTLGGGHTESDAFLHLADAGVLFAADLVLVRSHAWMGDGDPDAWPGIVSELADLPWDVLVPGHGDVGGRDDLDAFRSYLEDAVTAARERGPNAPVPDRYRDWDFADGWSRNLAFLTARGSRRAAR
jgi:glyoxylase-like metal-dependent hydrolase (beta-lactamase superfamily II)